MMNKIAGHRVLIKVDPIKKQTETGIIVVRDDEERDHKVNTSTGTVVAIGATAWMAYDYYKPNGERNPKWEQWCHVGDRVYFAKYAAKWIKDAEGNEYVVVNDQDIVAVIEEAEHAST